MQETISTQDLFLGFLGAHNLHLILHWAMHVYAEILMAWKIKNGSAKNRKLRSKRKKEKEQ